MPKEFINGTKSIDLQTLLKKIRYVKSFKMCLKKITPQMLCTSIAIIITVNYLRMG